MLYIASVTMYYFYMYLCAKIYFYVQRHDNKTNFCSESPSEE